MNVNQDSTRSFLYAVEKEQASAEKEFFFLKSKSRDFSFKLRPSKRQPHFLYQSYKGEITNSIQYSEVKVILIVLLLGEL